MTTCPRCNQPLRASTAIVPGATAYACRTCRLWWVDGHKDPIAPGEKLREVLATVAGNAKQDKEQTEAAMTVPITDVRWTDGMEWI